MPLINDRELTKCELDETIWNFNKELNGPPNLGRLFVVGDVPIVVLGPDGLVLAEE